MTATVRATKARALELSEAANDIGNKELGIEASTDSAVTDLLGIWTAAGELAARVAAVAEVVAATGQEQANVGGDTEILAAQTHDYASETDEGSPEEAAGMLDQGAANMGDHVESYAALHAKLNDITTAILQVQNDIHGLVGETSGLRQGVEETAGFPLGASVKLEAFSRVP